MVNKLHYMVDIILIVFYFGLPWISVFLFLFCLLILTTQTPIGIKVAIRLQTSTVSFNHGFVFVLSILHLPSGQKDLGSNARFLIDSSE